MAFDMSQDSCSIKNHANKRLRQFEDLVRKLFPVWRSLYFDGKVLPVCGLFKIYYPQIDQSGNLTCLLLATITPITLKEIYSLLPVCSPCFKMAEPHADLYLCQQLISLFCWKITLTTSKTPSTNVRLLPVGISHLENGCIGRQQWVFIMPQYVKPPGTRPFRRREFTKELNRAAVPSQTI